MALSSPGALPTVVRAGEHACLRTASGEARDRVTAALMAGELARGQKVVQLREGPGRDAGLLEPDTALGSTFAAAVGERSLTVVDAGELLERGAFDADRALGWLQAEHDAALGEGRSGLSVVADMAAVIGASSAERVLEYERRVNDEFRPSTVTLLCHYDLRRFPRGMHADAAALHDVDVSPELAEIARRGRLAAAVARPGITVRLAGELDLDSAESIGNVLLAHFHGALTLDLTDLTYVDVVGMRTLRGYPGQKLTITGVSPAALPLLRLLDWESDPQVEIR
jgi:hypothetical protein